MPLAHFVPFYHCQWIAQFMTYEISKDPDASVTFPMPNDGQGGTLANAPTGFNCLVNISSNLPPWMISNPGSHHFSIADPNKGNFTNWMTLGPMDAMAVSGLDSCGAIFVTNHNFSQVAAGHMSGDVQFVEDWCTLLSWSPHIAPHYLVFACGHNGGYNSGEVLGKYMTAFDLWSHPVRAPTITGTGSVLLMRTAVGAVVHARRNSTLISP